MEPFCALSLRLPLALLLLLLCTLGRWAGANETCTTGDYTVSKNGSVIFTVQSNGTCRCNNFVGSLALASNLSQNAEFAGMATRVVQLEEQVSVLQTALRTGLAGAFCLTPADCTAQANLTCSATVHRCVYARGRPCLDTTGVFCQPCADGLPTLSTAPVFQLDACDLRTLGGSGHDASGRRNVTAWGDSAGGSVAFRQSPLSVWAPPTLNTSAINGLPAVWFDGAGNYLSTNLTLPAYQSVALFSVIRPVRTTTDSMDVLSIIADNSTGGHGILYEITARPGQSWNDTGRGPRFLFRNPPGSSFGDSEEAAKQEAMAIKAGQFRITTMFSATMPPSVERLARTYLRRPATITIGNPGQAVDKIRQRIIPVKSEGDKKRHLLELLQTGPKPPVIVFANQKGACEQVAGYLRESNKWKVTTLHSGREQTLRDEAVAGFKSGKYDVMVATNVAGRGLDIKGVTHVINWDLPTGPGAIEDYTHRIGRTGRAGLEGLATSFLTNEDDDIVYDLRQMLIKTNNAVPHELSSNPAAQVKGARKRETVQYAKK